MLSFNRIDARGEKQNRRQRIQDLSKRAWSPPPRRCLQESRAEPKPKPLLSWLDRKEGKARINGPATSGTLAKKGVHEARRLLLILKTTVHAAHICLCKFTKYSTGTTEHKMFLWQERISKSQRVCKLLIFLPWCRRKPRNLSTSFSPRGSKMLQFLRLLKRRLTKKEGNAAFVFYSHW